MADCSTHRVPATGRCYTCHKPFCRQCNVVDGCCSQQCAAGRKKFANVRKIEGKEPLWPLILKIVIGIGLLAFAWSKRAQIIGFIEDKL